MISNHDFDEIINQSCIAYRQAAHDKREEIVANINKSLDAGEDTFKMTHNVKLDLENMRQSDELKFTPAPISTKVESPIDLEDTDEPMLPGIRPEQQGGAGSGDSGAPVSTDQPDENEAETEAEKPQAQASGDGEGDDNE